MPVECRIALSRPEPAVGLNLLIVRSGVRLNVEFRLHDHAFMRLGNACCLSFSPSLPSQSNPEMIERSILNPSHVPEQSPPLDGPAQMKNLRIGKYIIDTIHVTLRIRCRD